MDKVSAARGKCTKLSALIARKIVKSLSSQQKANQSSAEIASQNTRSSKLVLD